MITRQFKEEQYEAVRQYICTAARSSPMSGIYEVELTVNGESFAVYLQPDRHCKVHAICARSIYGGEPGPISGGAILMAMLELLAWQAVRHETGFSLIWL